MGFVGRQRQVEAVQLHENFAALEAERLAAEQSLAALMRPLQEEVLQLLAPWVAQYSEAKLRYKFLVLRAGSQCGKSTLAKALGQLFGWKGPFVQTVQDAEAADLKGFDRRRHGYIVFDNVNDMQFVLSQRALFQANVDIHTLGQSRTGMYSYNVWLHQAPIVVTVDLSAVWDSTELWIADNMNLVELDGPCFVAD